MDLGHSRRRADPGRSGLRDTEAVVPETSTVSGGLEVVFGLIGLLAGAAVFRFRQRLAEATTRDRERWRRRLRLRKLHPIEREYRVDGEAFVAAIVGIGWVLISLLVFVAGVVALVS